MICDMCDRKITKVYICPSECGYHEFNSCLKCLKEYHGPYGWIRRYKVSIRLRITEFPYSINVGEF